MTVRRLVIFLGWTIVICSLGGVILYELTR
jgi:hypothetical protein